MVDCDVIDKGCNGGLPINAFRSVYTLFADLKMRNRIKKKFKKKFNYALRKKIIFFKVKEEKCLIFVERMKLIPAIK